MVAWYLSLARANWKHRAFAAILAAMALSNLHRHWLDLHDSLAIARWIARASLIGAIVLLPLALLVLIGGRVPRAWSRPRGSLRKTLPQIHADVVREHRARGAGKRRF